MIIGAVTVDGRQVGVVTQKNDWNPDTSSPSFDDGVSPMWGDIGEDVRGDGRAHVQHHSRRGRTEARQGPMERGDGRAHVEHHVKSRRNTEASQASRAGTYRLDKGDDPRGMEGHIRSEAVRNHVDSDIAVKVAKSEGLRDFSGDHGTSFGAFQLHKRGGLGDEFQKETGLDPSDPKNEKATISWALKNVDRTGWGPYHGAARVGIDRREGIGVTGRSSVSGSAPSGLAPVAPPFLKGDDVQGFIMHHTGGRGTVEGVRNTLNQRGLGVEYVMDREGNIHHTGDRGAAHMKRGWGKGEGLSNRNTVGMEVIARDDKDVTPAQVQAAKSFVDRNYPSTPVYGHGEVNPGHKEADEGMTIVNAIRNGRTQAANKPASKPFDPETMVP